MRFYVFIIHERYLITYTWKIYQSSTRVHLDSPCCQGRQRQNPPARAEPGLPWARLQAHWSDLQVCLSSVGGAIWNPLERNDDLGLFVEDGPILLSSLSFRTRRFILPWTIINSCITLSRWVWRPPPLPAQLLLSPVAETEIEYEKLSHGALQGRGCDTWVVHGAAKWLSDKCPVN